MLDRTLAIDAGAVTRGLDLESQGKLQACLVSHAHLDHVRDLATLADNRCQLGSPPLVVAGTRATLESLRRHFFNGVLWPDFTRIPTVAGGNTIEFLELDLEKPTDVAGRNVTAIAVSHTIDCAGFVIEKDGSAIAYSGDTGPTDRLWEVLAATPTLKAMLVEVSFPDRHAALATVSGHYTPATLATDLRKLPRVEDVPTLLYHIKPIFQREVETELARLTGLSVEVPKLEDLFTF